MKIISWQYQKLKKHLQAINENTIVKFETYDQEFINKSDDIECRTNQQLNEVFDMLLSYKIKFIEYKSVIADLGAVNKKLQEENEVLRNVIGQLQTKD